MRISVNCRCILKPHSTGIGRYTRHLLDWLGRCDTQNQYLLYCPKKLFDIKRRRRLPHFDYANFTVKWDWFARGPWHTVGGYDVYHLPSPDAIPRQSTPVVVTVHDLIYKTWPQSQTEEMIEMTHKHMEAAASHAAKIICVSESTRRDLHRFFTLPMERSCVVYNGVDHDIFFPMTAGQKAQAARELVNHGIDGEFILFVGTLEPRKNLGGVFEAMAILKQKKQFSGKLVVSGHKGWLMGSLEAHLAKLGIKDDVIFLGHVDDGQLRSLYNLARAFVYPSFYEGFGLPIVEAMSCGAVVVTSTVSACPEIAGDGAMTTDPVDGRVLASTLASLLEDTQGTKALQARALARSKEFSFLKTARDTMKVYEKVYAR